MASKFTWVPLYGEIATRLLDWETRQQELVALLEQIRADGHTVTPLNDRDDSGTSFLLKELDPFTFFGTFNRGITVDNRLAILRAVKKHFDAQGPLPDDFDGIPVLNNLRSWFIAYQRTRKPDDVARLWKVFRLAFAEKPLDNPDFIAAFDAALEVECTNFNLTMGLFWIRPDTFLNLDQVNRRFLHLKPPSTGLTAKYYHDMVETVARQGKPFLEVSHEAWLESQKLDTKTIEILPPENNYWMGGAYWDGSDPPDQTKRFLESGIWQNGYDDQYLDQVREIRVGDRIALKSAFTRKNNLPFDSRSKTVSCMTINAIGTVVKNPGDGKTIEVEWEPAFQPKDWYFYTGRETLWRLRREDESANRLIEFAFFGKPQDYDWFATKRWGSSDTSTTVPPEPGIEHTPAFNLQDIIDSGVFLQEAELRQVLDRLHSKKNLILQGPPGVGKTFLARKLAYALMEEKDDRRIEFVQFHQSYSYEDFVRGFRPLSEKAGSFGLQDGVFFEFCHRAKNDPDRPYMFIIDEINRGNLSQIFGELLMLIEADKRGSEHALRLVYRKDNELRFFVPHNVYLIGLMNLADRSLALVDYALRRRFAFMTLKPQYHSEVFRTWLTHRGMTKGLIDLVVDRLGHLNRTITDDPLLGENYQVGHSFFCPKGEDFTQLDRRWYEGIIETEIVPLLKEYWFDNSKRVDELRGGLLAQ